jgi:hypothetical protein
MWCKSYLKTASELKGPKFANPWSYVIDFRYDLNHIQMDAIQFSCCHGVLICMVSINIIVEVHLRSMYLVNKFLKL